jgi:hypothetical protein
MSAAPFDPTPLTAPVDHAAVRAFTRSRRGSGATAGTVVGMVAAVIALVFVLAVFVPVFVGLLSSIGGSGASLLLFLPALGILAIVALVVVLGVRAFLGAGERAYRLTGFAAANGMTYLPRIDDPQLPGMIFHSGSARHSLDAVRGAHPRFVEFANYRYTTGSGKNRTTHKWGYVAIKLDVPLPHIVLDALGNNGLFGVSNLPASFDADQRLGLEGDFDRYFRLSAPEGYERDALYLFTPDIMARFIDNAAALDVEIVDDWLFLYGKREFSGLDPATWAWLFSVVAALLDKFAQWARWRDEKMQTDAAATASVDTGVTASGTDTGTALPFAAPAQALRPPPGVAQSGRRLKRGVPWGAVVVFILFALYWLWGQFDFFGFFDWLSGAIVP